MSDLEAQLSGEWVLDPQHTRIGFSARHAMVTRVRGAFNDVAGSIRVDAADPAAASVELRLGAGSVDTRSAGRDEHLRSADFFDVARFPDIVFRSSSVEEVGERAFVVVGDLTIKDITRQVSVPIELTGVRRDADGALRAGFEGRRRIDRRDWDLRWQRLLDAGGVLVSERITLEFEISAVKVESAGSTGTGPGSVTEQPTGPVRRARPGGRHRAPTRGWRARWRASGDRA